MAFETDLERTLDSLIGTPDDVSKMGRMILPISSARSRSSLSPDRSYAPNKPPMYLHKPAAEQSAPARSPPQIRIVTHLMMVSNACMLAIFLPLLSPFLPQSMPEMMPKSTSRMCLRAYANS